MALRQSSSHSLNRRSFLRLAGLAVAGTVLPACSKAEPPAPVAESTPVQEAIPSPIPSPTPAVEPIKITVTDWYDTNASERTRQKIDQALEDFKALYPNVEIEGHAGGYNPQFYAARLAAGTLESAYGMWFSEPRKFIQAGAAADITERLAQNEITRDFTPAALAPAALEGKYYGLPVSAYALGLLYNGKLFTAAGLDPQNPPQTWEELRQAAQAIKEKTGVPGYAEAAINLQGGWHLTAWMYTAGASPVTQHGEQWRANFTDPAAVSWLSQLKAMAFEDQSLQDEKRVDQSYIGALCGRGQCAMLLGGDPGWMVDDFQADRDDFYYTIPPGDGGNARGTLSGGYVYLFSASNTPAQIEAAVLWVTFLSFNLERYEKGIKADVEQGYAVGSPTMPLFGGETQAKRQAIMDRYTNLPQQNYQGYTQGLKEIKIVPEPPVKTQELYAALDVVVQSAVTNAEADLLKTLEEAQVHFQMILDAG